MKNLLLPTILFFSFQLIAAQEQISKSDEKIYETKEVDIKPDYPAGMEAFYNFVAKNFMTPDKSGLNGKVIITFVVEKDGSINDLKISQDIGFGSGKEAVRVIKKSEKWTPAQKKGQNVRCNYILPITIKTAN